MVVSSWQWSEFTVQSVWVISKHVQWSSELGGSSYSTIIANWLIVYIILMHLCDVVTQLLPISWIFYGELSLCSIRCTISWLFCSYINIPSLPVWVYCIWTRTHSRGTEGNFSPVCSAIKLRGGRVTLSRVDITLTFQLRAISNYLNILILLMAVTMISAKILSF